MALLLLVGVLLLAVWVWWTLYIVDRPGPVTVSLLVKVQQGEDYLDPFLRSVCGLFRQSMHVSLRDIWILSLDNSEEADRIVRRLNCTYPLFRFRSAMDQDQVSLTQAKGQLLVILDLVNRLTPLAALQAVAQLIAASPTPPGTVALSSGD